jgi:hypothetical protein
MDSQGFVLLSTVANFRRLRSITEGNYEILKHVAQQSHNIDFQVGIDGQDRIRKRQGWEPFVLEMAQRDESAQNDGVAPAPNQLSRTPSQYSDAMIMAQNAMMSNPMSPREPMSAFAINGQGYPEFQRMPSNDMIDYSRFQLSPPMMGQAFAGPAPPVDIQGMRHLTQPKDLAINGIPESQDVPMNGPSSSQQPVQEPLANGTTHSSA